MKNGLPRTMEIPLFIYGFMIVHFFPSYLLFLSGYNCHVPSFIYGIMNVHFFVSYILFLSGYNYQVNFFVSGPPFDSCYY